MTELTVERPTGVPTLTVASVAEAIDQLIIERGHDYVYPAKDQGGCYYSFPDGTPGCFVGAIIAKLDPEAFEKIKNAEPIEDDGNGAIRRESLGSVNTLIRDAFINVADPTVEAALARLQYSQDCGDDWDAAREAFVREARGWFAGL